MTTIFFVCIGNTCRSPMAAELFGHMMRLRGRQDVKADSFGIMPYYQDCDEVKRLREGAVQRLIGFVNGLTSHRPKGIESITFSEGDKIVLLDKAMLQMLFSKMEEMAISYEKLEPVIVLDVDDPYGGGPEDYFACCVELRDLISSNLDLILGMSSSQ